jgi:hypothetical protein
MYMYIYMRTPAGAVTRSWVMRLTTMARPGPIDHSAFVCRHGNLKARRNRSTDYNRRLEMSAALVRLQRRNT